MIWHLKVGWNSLNRAGIKYPGPFPGVDVGPLSRFPLIIRPNILLLGSVLVIYLGLCNHQTQAYVIGLHVVFLVILLFLFWSCGWGSFLISDLCVLAFSLNLLQFYFTYFQWMYLYSPLFYSMFNLINSSSQLIDLQL